jgi:DNA-binding HxlR family transcriptional regulator
MENCENKLASLQFILQVLGGKWKIYILSKLYFGKKRFKELEREVTGISPKMLIKELKDLESIKIVNRQTFNTVPITVEYSLTTEGLTLKPILDQLMLWSDNFINEHQTEKMPATNMGLAKVGHLC